MEAFENIDFLSDHDGIISFNFEIRTRPILSILIPTIVDRKKPFEQLILFLKNIMDLEDLHDKVEVIGIRDDKEMTIGEKRQRLYGRAMGLYSWQLDDDDCIPADAIASILEAAKMVPDCITFEERVIIDGVESRSNFSLKYDDWGENHDGFDYVRTPFFKTPIKTAICQQVPIPHIRFGEDHAYALAIKPLLHSEVHIDKQLYFYTHVSSDHNTRYGIKDV